MLGMADDDAYNGGDNDEFEEAFEDVDAIDEDIDADTGAERAVRPELRKLYQQHPELIVDYIESVIPLITSPDNHKTYPFLTLYEKTKIIGLRSNQLSQGAKPFVPVPEHVTNVRDIARLELEQKRMPFIVKRPLPNGKYEYWRLADLMIL